MNHDIDNQSWLTEVMDNTGTAFSLRLSNNDAKLHEAQTEFQKIEVWQTETFGRVMLIDGCVMLSTRDNFLYHEMIVHPALHLHSNPKKVAIIGGGDCGSLREVLKHDSVTAATQIDIDAGVTRASEQFFPELCVANDDPRATLLFDDGLKWIREAEPNSLDVIIVDSTDPVGPAEGLFGVTFFADCHRVLAEGGVLVQQSESPLCHVELIRNLRAAMTTGGFENLHTLHFPQPVYPTGWWSATLASKGNNLQRLRESQAGLQTLYYTTAIGRGALSTPPFLAAALS